MKIPFKYYIVYKSISTDKADLRVFQRKVIRTIFGPVQVGDVFRIQSNCKLYEIFKTWPLCSVLTMSFEWRRQDVYFMRESCEAGKEDDLVCVERTRL